MSEHGLAGSSSPEPIHNLIARFPELFGRDPTPSRRIAARHSRIDEFTGAGKHAPVIVKTITVSSSPEHAATVAGREFAALTWLHARVAQDLRATIPEPLAWIPGSPAIAMRKVGGVTLDRLLRRHGNRAAFWGGPRLERIGHQVGRWLRALHDATRVQDGTIDVSRLERDFDRTLEQARPQGLAGEAAHRVRQQARQAMARLAHSPVPRAARQGDFTVSNILVDGETVRIVDFENFGEADLVYEDLASFVGYLRMLGHSPAYSRARLGRMRRAFLRGYGQDESDPLLGLYELKHALAVLAQFPARPSSLGRWRREALGRAVVALGERLDVEVVRYATGAGDFRDAGQYDQRRYHGRANAYKREVMKAAYTSLVGPGPGLRVLDVGCGTGRGLADLASTGATLFGSDASVDMLTRAAAVLPEAGPPRLTAAYAQRLPFADESFDTVVSLNFLHLFSLETQQQMVAEMKRVLKPGGRLILEFDNALHGVVVGPFKRWSGREHGSLPREIRRVIGDDCRVLRRRGAVYPVLWRVFAQVPRAGATLEKLAYLPGIRWLAHRMYYEVQKPADA